MHKYAGKGLGQAQCQPVRSIGELGVQCWMRKLGLFDFDQALEQRRGSEYGCEPGIAEVESWEQWCAAWIDEKESRGGQLVQDGDEFCWDSSFMLSSIRKGCETECNITNMDTI
jgi:hypothetical protein